MARVLRVLNVAEKPSVAKTVAGILSGGSARTREGRSPYNKIFEFNYSIGSQACFMLMTSVTGHLMELEFEDQYRKWLSCDPADLYSAPVRKHVPQDKQALQRTLEEEARRCQWLVLWLDCDREGENIAFEVIEVCRSTNQHLNIWRAQFSALTERDIFHAVQNLARPNSLFSDAVDARQEIDLRIGASFTRMQTLLLSDAFIFPFAEDEKRLVLSYGPCQFPTLGFIVERYWEIQAHEPEDFWTINCSYTSEDGSCTFSWHRERLFDFMAAAVIYEMCIENPTATVYEVIGKERRKFPPHPLNTVELQKRASRYFRMGSEHTMKVAEELYQSGFISYPRTETDFFSENTNLQALVHEQVHHPVWGSYAQRLLDPQQNLWRNPSNGGHDDKAHPPIHPTKFSQNEPGWSADHARIYELVTRHFLACVSQPAVGYGTTVSIDIAGELFSATGLMITARNYLDVYRFDSWGDSILPTFDVGQQFIPTNLSLDMGTTKPPPLLSEADLISLMDQSGIGTDATMHDHIKKLLDRWYATKDAQTRFSPTKLGEALVMGYDSIGYELWKPYLRSTMERDMRAVSDGTKMKAQVLAECLQQMKDCFLDAKQHKIKLMEAMQLFFERSNRTNAEQRQVGEVVRLCPSCKEGNMVLKTRPDGGYMVGCLKYPLCRNVVWLPSATMEANVTTMTCSTCGPGAVFKIQFKFKRLEIPPQFSSDYTGCVGGCDQVLSEIIEMCGSGPRGTTAGGQSGAARQALTGGRGAPSIGGQRQQQLGGRGGGRSLHQQGGRSTPPPPLTGNQQRGGRSARQQGGRSAPVPPATERLVCLCEEVCVLLTANTENNRGRKFYRCPNRKCDFFMWETASAVDSNVSEQIPQARGSNARSVRPSNGQSSSNVGRNKKRGESSATTFVRATGETVASGACFVCGDPSHWANACPNRTS